jgi:hypothetical protein
MMPNSQVLDSPEGWEIVFHPFIMTVFVPRQGGGLGVSPKCFPP